MDLATLARRFTDTRDKADGLYSEHAKNRAAILELYESKTVATSEIIDALDISPSRFWQIIAKARLEAARANA